MKATIRLTLDGLKRALRMRGHAAAEAKVRGEGKEPSPSIRYSDDSKGRASDDRSRR